GGFASTVCWPLSAFLLEQIGWRGACFVYAGLHLLLGAPLQLWVLRDGEQPATSDAEAAPGTSSPDKPAGPGVTLLLALILSLAAGIGSIVVVHLLTFLQAGGLGMAAAVSLGMLFGPAQVGARMIERLFGQHYHPLWTLLAATLLM